MAHFTTKEGVKLFYQCSLIKNKPALVFVHGLAGSGNVWRSYVNQFNKQFGVLSFDLRGHSKSSCAEEYHLKDFSKDLHELIQHLKIKDKFLFGYSLGGLIISDYIVRYKVKPKGIVLISSLFDYNDLRNSFWIKFKFATIFPQFVFRFLIKFKSLFERNLYLYFNSLAKTSHQAIFGILNSIKNYGQIKVLNDKKLIIVAEKDNVIKNLIKEVYPNYTSINSDHLAIIKEEKKIIKVVKDFLES